MDSRLLLGSSAGSPPPPRIRSTTSSRACARSRSRAGSSTRSLRPTTIVSSVRIAPWSLPSLPTLRWPLGESPVQIDEPLDPLESPRRSSRMIAMRTDPRVGFQAVPPCEKCLDLYTLDAWGSLFLEPGHLSRRQLEGSVRANDRNHGPRGDDPGRGSGDGDPERPLRLANRSALEMNLQIVADRDIAENFSRRQIDRPAFFLILTNRAGRSLLEGQHMLVEQDTRGTDHRCKVHDRGRPHPIARTKSIVLTIARDQDPGGLHQFEGQDRSGFAALGRFGCLRHLFTRSSLRFRFPRWLGNHRPLDRFRSQRFLGMTGDLRRLLVRRPGSSIGTIRESS